MHNKFTQKAQNTLKNALNEAGALGHAYMGSEHLLLGLTMEKDSIAARLLSARGIDEGSVRESIIEITGRGDKCRLSSKDMTPRAKRIIEESGRIAKKNGCTYIGTEHILTAILEETGAMGARIVEASGVPLSLILSDLVAHQGTLSQAKEKDTPQHEVKPKIKSSGALAAFSRDMTANADKLDPTIGRDEETDRLVRILSRRTKNNPCLVGEPGVGKTAIVEGLAKRISEGNVPPALACKRILCLDIPSMIAGAKYRGEFEERMKNVMAEAQKNTDVILFIDEIHVIVGAGAAEGAVDAANILKPALARGDLRLIGATTVGEFRKHIQKDPALERRFQAVMIEEPTPDATVDILTGLRPKYEAHHKVRISDEAIRTAVDLSVRYVTDRFLPDKAIDILDEAAAKCSISAASAFPELPLLDKQLSDIRAQIQGADKNDSCLDALKEKEASVKSRIDSVRREMRKKKNQELFTVTAEQIAAVVTAQTAIPTERLLNDERTALKQLGERLESRIVGQAEAISSVLDVIRRGRVGLRDPNRPVGSFLFVGKSGVGKTALASALAEELMGSKKALLRFDMSEFSEKHSVSKMIGSPPGYVGFGEGGRLTEGVLRRPYSVVLLDEIEKAHSDIFDLLLQVLEDGKLKDSQGREVSFRNAVIIMTSNEGTERSARITGFGDASVGKKAGGERINDRLKARFRPEFLNRIDEIVTFNELDVTSLEAIADIQLKQLELRARELGHGVVFHSSVASAVASLCRDQGQGARGVRRVVAKQVEGYVAQLLLEGELNGNCETVFSAVERDGEIKFSHSTTFISEKNIPA